MYPNREFDMESVSIKQARQKFAQLVDKASSGTSVAITRRGRQVAKLVPPSPAKSKGLPDLTEFRASLGKPPRNPKVTVRAMRDAARY